MAHLAEGFPFMQKQIRKIYKKFGTYFHDLTFQQISQEIQFNQQIF